MSKYDKAYEVYNHTVAIQCKSLRHHLHKQYDYGLVVTMSESPQRYKDAGEHVFAWT